MASLSKPSKMIIHPKYKANIYMYIDQYVDDSDLLICCILLDNYFGSTILDKLGFTTETTKFNSTISNKMTDFCAFFSPHDT